MRAMLSASNGPKETITGSARAAVQLPQNSHWSKAQYVHADWMTGSRYNHIHS
mgnify:CR=1 FL=1